jgi:hypothetical protein
MISFPSVDTPPVLALGLAAGDGLTSSAAASIPLHGDHSHWVHDGRQFTRVLGAKALSGKVAASPRKGGVVRFPKHLKPSPYSASCGMSALHADAAHRDLGSSPTWPARKCAGRFLVGRDRLSFSAPRRSWVPSSLSELRSRSWAKSSLLPGQTIPRSTA